MMYDKEPNIWEAIKLTFLTILALPLLVAIAIVAKVSDWWMSQ